MRNFKTQDGMSLVEATIILMVLMLLTGVLAPSINDFVNDAKHVKAKEDCEAIGISVARLVRDVGQCIKRDGRGRCTQENRVDLLFSDGARATHEDLGPEAVDFTSGDIKDGSINWACHDHQNDDNLEDHLVRNGRSYPTPSDRGTFDRSGPHGNLGWRGAYVSPGVGPDPWGNTYLVNSVFLAVAENSNSQRVAYHGGGNGNGNNGGHLAGGWSQDTICITASANGLYESPFGGTANGGTRRLGDDLIFVISGDSR